jgi:murein tripeptide amidase MpaA
MTAVKATPVDPTALAAQLKSAGEKAGFRYEAFGMAGETPLFALTKRTTGVRPRIYLSGGIHGDEPAPPLALLSLLESGQLDGRAMWFLCPMLNPLSLARGTRESEGGVDLNRDYRHLESPEVKAHVGWLRHQPNFDVAVCVHEDWESKGFYLYELNPDKRPSPIDLSPLIEGREARGGVISPAVDPEGREKWPEAIYLQVNHTRLTYTLETPSSLPLEQRVATHRAALFAAIDRTVRPHA